MLPFFGNEPPVIKSNPPSTAKIGDTYIYQVDATDDNDVLKFSLNNSPVGMTMDDSGLIEWSPTEDQVGNHTVQLKVSDGWNSVTQEFTVEVKNIKLDSISVLPENMTILRGSTVSITSITAHYDDGSSVQISKSDCEYESSNVNLASVNIYGQVVGKIAGSVTITVSYSENDVTVQDTVSVTVQNPPTGGG